MQDTDAEDFTRSPATSAYGPSCNTRKAMSNMRDIFDGALVSLECLGNIPDPRYRFLDGVTDAHQVKLSPQPFTGARWHCKENTEGNFTFASAGDRFGYRYLDGRTRDGIVQLVGDTLSPFTGTAWRVEETSPGIVTMMCRGDFINPDHQFLDGNTIAGSIGLAPRTGPDFSGTAWRTTLMAVPSLDVRTIREAITSTLKMSGSGFTPNDDIRFVAEGIVGRQDHAPFSFGAPVSSSGDGRFTFEQTVGRFATHPADVNVTIRATDHHGITATDMSDGFHNSVG